MRDRSIELLQSLESLAANTRQLEPSDEELVRSTFKKILENGDIYSVAELENWFMKNAEATDRSIIDRIMNIAHYQKSKFEASNKFRMVSDGNKCGCGSGH